MLSLDRLVAQSDAELARHDIAAVSLASARGLPGSEKIDVRRCLGTLDRWARRVGQLTGWAAFDRNPGHWDHSRGIYRMHVMMCVLQGEFGVRYNPAMIPADAKFGLDECFIHGVIQGAGGTCGTLPVIYVAVGRRLGYPLKLVAAQGGQWGHLFLRWDESGGERFNIEMSNGSFDCQPDDYYRTGRYTTHPDWEQSGSILKSMTPREELADFMAQRSACWLDAGNRRLQAESLAWACALAPHNVLYRAFFGKALDAWNEELERRKPPGFPDLYLRTAPPGPFPSHLPEQDRRNLVGLSVTDYVLKDPTKEQAWWAPMRAGCRLPRSLAALDIWCSGSGYHVRERYGSS
jgi:hypothetical protein